MKDLPFISIIIASFNGRYYLDGCLSSIGNLDYPKEKMEVILIDDGSQDKTYEFIKENFSNIKIIRNRRNRGVAEARNIGIKNAKGKLLAFIDNDVKVEKNWLFELVKAIEEDKRIGICASKILFKDRPDILNSTGGIMNIYADAWDRGVFQKDTGQYDSKKRVFFGCSAAMLIRKDVLERIGDFDPVLYIYEDVDLGWRVNLAGYRIIYVPGSIAYHKFGGTIRRDNLKGKYLLERNRLRIMLKNYEGRTLLKNIIGLLKFKIARFNRHIDANGQLKLSLLACAVAAWAWNLSHILDTLKRRREIQYIKTITDKEIFELMGNYKYESLNL
ncbi:MAG: glycosyltransferase family 2 protein [Candidatus Omnitrophota bacterium]|nr:glycosyltransferase family 2 protein [Candidatus Omnitrophota bacterium]